jgi:YD repeat-containing protein
VTVIRGVRCACPAATVSRLQAARKGDGQPASKGDPNGNTTTYGYDALGRSTTKETKTGATSRAAYTWTRNQAGEVLSEASSITSDPTNGTRTYAYDALARLTAFTDGATTTAYGWAAATVRRPRTATAPRFAAHYRHRAGELPPRCRRSNDRMPCRRHHRSADPPAPVVRASR